MWPFGVDEKYGLTKDNFHNKSVLFNIRLCFAVIVVVFFLDRLDIIAMVDWA